MSSVAGWKSSSSTSTQFMTSPFTDFFASDDGGGNNNTTNTNTNSQGEKSIDNWGIFDHQTYSAAINSDKNHNSEMPRFKSFAPPSLPPVSPSSYLASPLAFSPSVFLDSPLLFPNFNNFPSPTVGALASHHGLSNKQGSSGGGDSDHQAASSDFSFQTQIRSSATNSTEGLWNFDQSRNAPEQNKNISRSEYASKPIQILHPETTQTQIQKQSNQQPSHPQSQSQAQQQQQQQQQQPPSYQFVRSHKRSEDGYNWRKYGQKQVKGSENPRSYYKCSFPGCPTKKKVERSLEGHITEIVYKGSHNHPKPQPRRSSSSYNHHPAADADINNTNHHQQQQGLGSSSQQIMDHSPGITPETSSVSMDEEDDSSMSRPTKDDDSEPEPKRWKGDNESEVMSAYGSKAVREPRVVVQTTSEIDILDDGYRWRKYGQKVVKGNPNPRSYYKCTSIACPVRKHIERAAHDLRAVITTYEGKHNHDIPAARGSSYALNRPASAPVGSGSGINMLVPVRPEPISGHANHTAAAARVLTNNTTTQPQPSSAPATLEWLQNPSGAAGGYGFSSGYGNHNTNGNGTSYTTNNQAQQFHHAHGHGGMYSRAKEEQTDHNPFLGF